MSRIAFGGAFEVSVLSKRKGHAVKGKFIGMVAGNNSGRVMEKVRSYLRNRLFWNFGESAWDGIRGSTWSRNTIEQYLSQALVRRNIEQYIFRAVACKNRGS